MEILVIVLRAGLMQMRNGTFQQIKRKLSPIIGVIRGLTVQTGSIHILDLTGNFNCFCRISRDLVVVIFFIRKLVSIKKRLIWIEFIDL
jgi:hypothetical protein